MGGLDDVGVKMRRWGVEMRGWEPKHVVESQWVYYKENKSKKPEKLKKKMYGPNDARHIVWACCCCHHPPRPPCAFKT